MASASDKPPTPPTPEAATLPPKDTSAEPALTCDFCGEPAPVVRRVVLDRGYERLQTLHSVRYACPRCSEEKEQRRLGLRRG